MSAALQAALVLEDPQFCSLVGSLAARIPADLLFLEIGTRAGDSAKRVLNAIANSGVGRWFFTVDPYGMRPYPMGAHVCVLDYDDVMYRRTMRNLYALADDLGVNYCHWRMTSVDFLHNVLDRQIEFWSGGASFQQSGVRAGSFQIGFAYLDGEHVPETVLEELRWVLPRLAPGGVILVDDVQMLVEPLPATQDRMRSMMESLVGKATATAPLALKTEWNMELQQPYQLHPNHYRVKISQRPLVLC